MDLTLQQLRSILAVHEEGGFTAAAERLHLAQSSLSRTVLDVERKLGITLFERTTRRLTTTPEGVEFCAIARRVTDSFDAGMRHFDGFLTGSSGRVRVATLPSLAAILLPPVISAHRAAHPGIGMSIEDALSGEVLRRVRSGDVDLAVTVLLDDAGDDLEAHPLATDRFCCVFPPAHRFADRDSLRWDDLDGEPYIAFDAASSIRAHTDRATAAARVHPELVVAVRNIAAVAGLVAAGLGVSVVPGLVLPLVGFAGLEHRPLREPEVHRRIAVVRDPARPLTAAAADFRAALLAAHRTPLPAEASWHARAE
ncbi:LysR family transcriptional regulator [Saccharopolyspora sp. NFXS83]|uniref:LysR family transcriptional regulator n=1 Tax=Saccharopolyspora sp. NFXS83 TaxID=2993560 RepID=UPI00224B107F|nr:LysR family transcriptional regulator [Saccharopolyspora sp. NFXS83]MCX2728909.1 LysR family transcriptional regulator [Saccharopolyspora sp. NFXS83]